MKAKVQGYVLNTERIWGKTGRQERVHLPEVAVALRDANIAVFKSKDGGQKSEGKWGRM